MNYQVRIKTILAAIFYSALLFIVIMSITRYIMFLAYVDMELLVNKSSDVQKMFLMGVRYDLRFISLSLLPIILVSLLVAIKEKYYLKLKLGISIYIMIIGLLIIVMGVINFFYYQTYHNHIDIFIFNLVNGETIATLKNIYEDYPVILIVFFLILMTYIYFWIISSLLNKELFKKKMNKYLFIFAVFIYFLGFFIFARGSISTFPLRKEDSQVSNIIVLNKLTPNGFFALDWANKARKRDQKFRAVSKEKGKKLLKLSLSSDNLVLMTPKNKYLEKNKPNVVLAIMESMGSNMLVFDSEKDNDLLGSLRSHFKNDFIFSRFISSGNGTMPSLANIMFNSVVSTISQSSMRNKKLQGSIFTPYKKAGYKTVFIYPGNAMWQNLVNYLPVQDVDLVVDQNTIMNLYPESKEQMTPWGVPDEYAFKYIKYELQTSKKPIFLVLMSTTNHPPYKVPDTYSPENLILKDLYSKRSETSSEEDMEMLETYQYASNCLGDFITYIKANKLSHKTIIGATGDHQMRRIKAKQPSEMMLDKAVPYYIYIPDEILNKVKWKYDITRVGSHKDVIPTLMHFSLSEALYFNLGGKNILSNSFSKEEDFGINNKVWITYDGAYSLDKPIQFYEWLNNGLLLNTNSQRDASKLEIQKIEAYKNLQRWLVNYQIMGYVEQDY